MARKIAPRKLPEQSVVGDLNGLGTIVATNLARAEKDNEFVYLQATTSPANLPDIGRADVVKASAPADFSDPVSARKRSGGHLWFERLTTYGVDVSVRVYQDRKQQYLETQLDARARDIAAAAQRYVLSSLGAHLTTGPSLNSR